MASVSATNGLGMAELTQLLSASSSPLRQAGLSSSQVKSTLQDASTSDIAQLSDAAAKLQLAGGLFGTQDTSQTASLFSTSSSASSSSASSSDILDGIFKTLSTTADSTSSSSGPSVTDQFASYRTQLLAEKVQTLFGTDSTSSASGTLLNVFA
jgi:hypothetical protein